MPSMPSNSTSASHTPASSRKASVSLANTGISGRQVSR
jgi:hypothetical protein